VALGAVVSRFTLIRLVRSLPDPQVRQNPNLGMITPAFRQ
jgi:hypothetical protein